MKMKKAMPTGRQGFTLIELLVVISVIGILTTLVMANLNAARERARDAQRKSDLRSIQTALRLYYNDVGGYPAGTSTIMGCDGACTWGQPWIKNSITYMNILPNDPLPGQTYKYTGSADFESYTLIACLENKSDEKGQVTTDTSWCLSGWMYQVKP